ncbi:MAG: hypothetical protein IPH08_05515 [Rhodocyclaceae bacterium]|nr:hypothetical protein [Rhodocyclaceae bacterium]
MGDYGLAYGQIADMQDWYVSLQSRITGPLTVTGYSLGGHLATAFNILNPNAAQVVTFNGAGIGLTSTPLSTIIREFDQRRDVLKEAIAGPGLIDLFKSEAGRTAYKTLRELGRTVDAVRGAVSDVIELILRESQTGDARADYQLLKLAFDRASKIRRAADTIDNVTSGDGSPNPAPIPLVNIDGTKLDYQLAVITTAQTYPVSTRNLIADGTQLLLSGGLTRAVASGLPPQTDLVGWEVSASDPVAMVANSLYHVDQGVKLFIEDQPQRRGGVAWDAAIASVAQMGVRLVVPGFSQKDFGDDHSILLIIDSLNVQNTLLKLMSLSQQQNPQPLIDSILKHASHLVAEGNSGQGKA